MFWRFIGIFIVLAALANFGDSAEKKSLTRTGKKQPDYSFCGQTLPRPSSRVKRVIGGREAKAHAWPWQVLILNYTSVFCSGSIISPTFLITAAHCVDKANSSYLKFYVGKHWVTKKDQYEQQLQVKQIIIHPKYRRGNLTNPGDNDIALLKLKDPIKFTDGVRPICLADAKKFEAGHECVLSGWGITNTTVKTIPNTLQQLRLPLVSKKVCNSKKSYGGIIHERYLCAGVLEGGKDGCLYDSGGPLSCASSQTDPWYLVGMMVWGDGCAKKNKYGVYANVTKFINMIKSIVKDLPRPYSTTQNPPSAQTSSKDKDKTEDEHKEKIFIAIIASLCVIIVILLTTLCIVNFYSRGYICCTPTDKVTRHHKAPRVLHEQNGKLNGEVSV